MYKTILTAYDGSAGSKNSLETAIGLAKKFNSKILAIWVAGSLPQFHETKAEFEEEIKYTEIFFNKLQQEISEYCKKNDIIIEFSFKKGNAAKTIVEYAKDKNADLIVIGHSGHSNLWGRFLGHVPDKVSDNAHCDVLIVRTKIDNRFEK